MGLIKANKLLRVGVKQFDDEHDHLVQITNQLHDSIKSGHGRHAVQAALQQLTEFAARHFQSEEQLLRQFNYPELDEHQQAHQKILDQLAEIQTGLQDNIVAVQHMIMQFLLDWLTSHTKTVDKQYGQFLNSRGIY